MGLGYGESVAFAMKPEFDAVGGRVCRTDVVGRPVRSIAGGEGAAE